MFRFVLIVLAVFVVSVGSIYAQDAEPYRQFGDEGAYYWSRTSVYFHGLFPLNAGGQVLRTWSANQAEDGDRQVYLQIVNGDGSTVYDPPIQLSDDEMFVGSNGAAGVDRDGNIYVAWLSAFSDDPETAHLFVQKFNSDCEPQWGQHAQDLGECDFAPKAITVVGSARNEYVIPDENGGCYYITRHGLFAIDSNGEIREDWDWHYEQLTEEYTMLKALTDEDGGFWCSVFGRTDDEQRLDIGGLNHYSFSGERLWDEYQIPYVDGLPQGTHIEDNFIIPIENGIVCTYNLQQMRRLVVLNSDWSLRGEQYIYTFPDGTYPRNFLKLRNGNILFRYKIQMGDFNSYNINIYDPESSELILGNEGVVLREEDQQFLSLQSLSEMVETTDGSLIVPIGLMGDSNWCEVYGLSPDGEHLWNEPAVVGTMGNPLHMTAGQEGSFWLAGERVNSLSTTPPYSLNRYTQDGEPVHNGNMEIGAPVRAFGASHVWFDQDRNYKIFGGSYRSFTIQTLDDQGNIIGDPNGQELLEIENEQYDYSPTYYQVAETDDNILVCWRDFYADEPNAMKLMALDLGGDIEWTMDVIDQNNRDYPTDLIASPDGDHAAIVVAHFYSDSLRYTYPVLYWIDLESQEVEWNVSFENCTNLQLVITDDFIYAIRDENDDQIFVDKFDLNGHQVWNEPFLTRWQIDIWGHVNNLFGAAESDDGGVLLAYSSSERLGQDDYSAFAWIEKVDPNGEGITDSLSFYSEPLHGNIRRSDVRFNLIESGNNLWSVPLQDIPSFLDNELILPIQGITLEGDRLMDDIGFILNTPENHQDRDFIGNSDGVGGLWITWERRDVIENSQKCFTLHFDVNGDLSEGWDSGGVNIFGNYFRECIKLTEATGNNGLVVLMGGDQNHDNYHLQHMMLHHPDDVTREERALPEEFSIEDVYPNPFNSQTRITYSLPLKAHIDIKMFDISGREVMTLFSGVRSAGVWNTVIDGTDLASGLYFVRLSSAEQQVSQKLMLLK